MQKTRKTYVGTGMKFTSYRQLAKADVIGFAVSLCEHDERPFVLLRAKSWTGEQPRFLMAAVFDEDFLPCLRNLKELGGVKREVADVELVSEETIYVSTGLLPLKSLRGETADLWRELTSLPSSMPSD